MPLELVQLLLDLALRVLDLAFDVAAATPHQPAGLKAALTQLALDAQPAALQPPQRPRAGLTSAPLALVQLDQEPPARTPPAPGAGSSWPRG